MKRIIKNPIFTFILGAVIFGSIAGVVAYNVTAKQIGYTPSDNTWDVNNVESALNSIKQEDKTQITNLQSAVSNKDLTIGQRDATILDLNSQIASLQNQVDNPDCVISSFTATSAIANTTGTGQKINLGFRPSFWYDFSPDFNQGEVWDSRRDNLLRSNLGNAEVHGAYTDFYTLDDTSLSIRRYDPSLVGKIMYYVACK